MPTPSPTRLPICLICLFVTAAPGLAQPIDWVSNLEATPQGSNQVTASSWAADKFTTPGFGTTAIPLETITLKLHLFSEGFNPSNFDIRIYSDGTGGLPGSALLGTISYENGSTGSDFPFRDITFSVSGISLEQNSTYWLSAGATNDDYFNWAYTNGPPVTGTNATITGDFTFSYNGGSLWEDGGSDAPGMYALSAAPVPEPATVLGIAAVGLAAGSLVRRVRRASVGAGT